MTCAACCSDLILAINGADERLQLALGRHAPGSAQAPELLASQEWTVPGQAVRFLTPGIKAMLDGLGLAPKDVGRIACVTGPGSFTGLRMSLAAAEGLAAATGALLAGVGHLELLAREAATAISAQGAVLALAWSRRGQVYAQAFAGQDALGPPQSLPLAELDALLPGLPQPLLALGGGLRRNLEHFEALAERIPGLRLLPPEWDAPRPAALLALAAQAEFRAGPLAPAYLRASDAEDNLAAIAGSRGLAPEQAREILARGSRPL